MLKEQFEVNYTDKLRLLSSIEKTKFIKILIYLYVFLLIFEGAFRKWIFPEFSAPLVLIREPVALLTLMLSVNYNILRSNVFLLVVLIVAIASFINTLILGHGNMIVAIYGLRIFLVHFPLIFVIEKVFNRQDVIQFGKYMVFLSIPMIILVIIQFYSPQSSFVNVGVGGDSEGAGLAGALGFFRPSATFSFTNGNTLFWSLLAPYIIYFAFNKSTINKFVVWFSSIAFLLALVFSISRALVFQAIICVFFLLIVQFFNPKKKVSVINFIVILILISYFLFNSSYLEEPIDVLFTRFESASEIEGGLENTLVDRFLGGMYSAIFNSSDLPFWGYGLGMGTNVASQLLTGKRTFLIAEEEWARVIGELGLLFGLVIVFVRIALSTIAVIISYLKLKKGDQLSWIFLSVSILITTQGGLAQPTALGFFVVITGIQLSLNK